MKLLQLKSRKNLVKIQSNLLKNIGNAASQGFQTALVTFFFEHVVYFIRQITYYDNFYFEVMNSGANLKCCHVNSCMFLNISVLYLDCHDSTIM